MLTVFLALIAYVNLGSQQPNNFGEGIVGIRMYVIPLQANFAIDTINKDFYGYQYYIKESMILRNDEAPRAASDSFHATNSSSTMVSGTLSAVMKHPTYLIDWNRKLSYIFYSKNSQAHISKTPLKDNTFEVFYRLAIPDSSFSYHVISQREDTTYTIGGYPCFKGAMLKNMDTILFYYTKVPMDVCSPLNAFVPNFSYQILSVLGHVKNGPLVQAKVAFTVSKITSQSLPDSLFKVSSNAIMKENVPPREMYNPKSQ